MKRWVLSWLMVGWLVGLVSGPEFAWAQAEQPGAFALAQVHMEQNVTDRDLEVVFSVQGGDAGLAHLQVVGPDGRMVIRADAPDASTLGARHFNFETPESSDRDKIKAAYPAGRYVFSGNMLDGTSLRSTASLRHDMPPAAVVIYPKDGAEDMPTEGLKVTWKALPGIVNFIVEVEQEELGVNVTATLPASVTTFEVPGGFLQAGMEYKLAVGTIGADGNVSFIESEFTTAK
jgi:hypothetical protein